MVQYTLFCRKNRIHKKKVKISDFFVRKHLQFMNMPKYDYKLKFFSSK